MFLLKREFLEEMRLEFSRREMASESLTKKTTNLMTIAGIISAVLLGLYTSPLEPEADTSLDWSDGIWGSVALLIITVGLCVVLNRVEFQKTPFLGKKFLDKSGNIDLKILKSWTNASEEDYYEILSGEYIKCLTQAEKVIETKSKGLIILIILFLIGLVSGSIFLGLSIFTKF